MVAGSGTHHLPQAGTASGVGTRGARTLKLQVPKLREGGYVPSFIEHRKRSEQAMISVIQEAVVKGVSTRKIEAVLEELGIAGVSANPVSQLCAALDEKVRKFREATGRNPLCVGRRIIARRCAWMIGWSRWRW